MEQVDQYSYYKLGTSLARLSAVLPIREAKKFGTLFFAMYQAQENLREIIKSQFFVHSKSVARELLARINEVDKQGRTESEDSPYDFDKEIQFWEVSTIKERISELETVMARESPTVPIFFIPQKGIYKTDELINQAENMFSAELQKGIPKQAITDVHEAGRCVAFELPTAAGFHVLRATEALTREYYKFVTNKDSGKTDWGACIDELRKESGADRGLLELLDQIREERNTVMHPRRNLSMDEAIAVVNLAQAAISRTAIDMMSKGPQQRLVVAQGSDGPVLIAPTPETLED